MPVKLFALSNEAESKQLMSMLEEADMDYELIEPDTTLMGYEVMFSVTGSKKTPILCVDGKAYRGVAAASTIFG